jgi:hypothetical protein
VQVDQKIVGRLDDLIAQAAQVGRHTVAMYMGPDRIQSEPVNEWGGSCLNLLGRVFGEGSLFYTRFDKLLGTHVDVDQFAAAVGIMKAARAEYAGGYLFNTRALIAAEVFDEFLQQAEYLLQSGYHQPAAVVAGAVLEDGLRKLCDRHGIALPDNPKLDRMNADLAKAGAYNVMTQKLVTYLAALRNKAAHGEWDKFSEADVATMLPQVRVFMATHFS